MNVFILCAGDGTRWDNHLDIQKQLIRFGAESIIERTIRISSVYRDARFFCVVRERSINLPNATSIGLKYSSCLADTIMQTKPFWASRNIFLFGDVFYSPAAIHTIFHNTSQLAFFGRPWASSLVKCGHGELFGMTFDINISPFIQALLEAGMHAYSIGHQGNLWNLHHIASGLPLGKNTYSKELLELIDDYTNDIDTPIDYIRRRELFEQIATDHLRTKITLWMHRRMMFLRRYRFVRYSSAA